RRWVLVGLGVVVVAGATALIVMSTGTRESSEPTPATDPARPAAMATSKVRFDVQPRDAEIRIDGAAPHVGAPWAAELAAGTHPVEVRHAGYKSWLTSLEVVGGRDQLVGVELIPLGTSTTADADATLSIATTPPGLEAVLDGKLLEQHTPIKLSIKLGAHTVAVRQNGVEVWHQNVNAEPSSDYEFHPSFADKRPAPPPPPLAPHHGSTHPAPKLEPVREPEAAPPAPPTEAPPSPPSPEPQPLPQPPPQPPPQQPQQPLPQPQQPPQPAPQPQPSSPPPQPAKPPAAPTTPVLVAPTAVTKVSGDPPHLEVSSTDLPAVAVAKLCIDPTGAVTSATVLTKLPRNAGTDLALALHGWRYAPYKQGGTAVPACFTVSFRLK
ncbi:MAG TPA: PEGA domain-containing protein, partial [Kofleriaceae bacterium]|nr:PEGA domain-containing protein [Kofleriaceae bacterium]